MARCDPSMPAPWIADGGAQVLVPVRLVDEQVVDARVFEVDAGVLLAVELGLDPLDGAEQRSFQPLDVRPLPCLALSSHARNCSVSRSR